MSLLLSLSLSRKTKKITADHCRLVSAVVVVVVSHYWAHCCWTDGQTDLIGEGIKWQGPGANQIACLVV